MIYNTVKKLQNFIFNVAEWELPVTFAPVPIVLVFIREFLRTFSRVPVSNEYVSNSNKNIKHILIVLGQIGWTWGERKENFSQEITKP